MTGFQDNKALVRRYYDALDSAPADRICDAIRPFYAYDCLFRGVHPFNELRGAEAIADTVWTPLRLALGPWQRRMDIFFAGQAADGAEWVCSMGHFIGLHDQAWLGIRPTGKLTFVRYADFNRVEDGRIVDSGFFVDIVSVMKQAGSNPLPDQTGAEIITPGPQTCDGLLFDLQPCKEAGITLDLVNRMIADIVESYGDRMSPNTLRKTWHEDMLWFGPSGIGATHTIPRYQQQHQFPFRDSFCDFKLNGHVARFAEGNYAGFFGWPNLTLTPTGGFLGMPASDQPTHLRVVDIYRRKGDKLAENWIFIDFPYWLLQQGVDILKRNATIHS